MTWLKLMTFAAVAVIVPAASATGVQAQDLGFAAAPWWMQDNVVAQTGYVVTEVPANRASFTATFVNTDTTVEKAQGAAIARTRGLQEVLGKLGRDKVRITTSFSMSPLYQQYRDHDGNRVDDERGDKINGYEVSLVITVEVRDLSQLETAYNLVMAAAPTKSGDVAFLLQPSNEMVSWLSNEATKDARIRAQDAVSAAGGRLGAIRLVDPSGRACRSDVLAPARPPVAVSYAADFSAGYEDTEVVVTGVRKSMSLSAAPPPPPPGSAAYLEQQAQTNAFTQTPPLQRITAESCVIYGLE